MAHSKTKGRWFFKGGQTAGGIAAAAACEERLTLE